MRGIFVCTIKLLQKYIVKKIFLCYNIKLSGGVAHLGERDIRIVEVTGSSPAVSTIQKSLEAMRLRGFFLLKKRIRDGEVLPFVLPFYKNRAGIKSCPIVHFHETNRILPFCTSTVKIRLIGSLSAIFKSK